MPRFVRPRHAAASAPSLTSPLVVTSDEHLLDELLRIAALAGAELTVAPDLVGAGVAWSSAPAVIVGADALGATSRLPRRPGVVIAAVGVADPVLWQAAVHLGAEDVVAIPTDDDLVQQRFVDALDGGSAAPLIGIVGARGGVGTTSVAVATAIAASQRGARTLLVDLDPRSGGIDLVLGAEDAEGLRWSDLGPAEGRIAPASLLRALPTAYGLHVLSCSRSGEPIDPAAVDTALHAASRAFDAVIVDLPGHLDAATAAALRRLRLAVLVAPAEVRGCAAGQSIAESLNAQVGDLGVIVRPGVGRSLDPIDVAAAIGVPLFGEIRDDPRAPAAYERGDAPSLRTRGVWRRACDAVLDHVGVVASQHGDHRQVAS